MALSNHMKIVIGWSIAITTGLLSFYLSKKYIDNHRYEAMKARQRIATSADDPNLTKRAVPKQFQ